MKVCSDDLKVNLRALAIFTESGAEVLNFFSKLNDKARDTKCR